MGFNGDFMGFPRPGKHKKTDGKITMLFSWENSLEHTPTLKPPI
jgi:hypothetical protein